MNDGLAAAFLVGLGFGWAIERAGLGSARKLMGQFMLTDFTVFKVMFSAIVTAMLGVFWLGRLGLVDVDQIYVPETFLLPQVVGGLVFGVGFVLAGLCPGTSCVAAASGRVDGLVAMLGMLAGTFAAGAVSSALQPLYLATPYGRFQLDEWLGLPYGVVVLLVVLVALAGFQAVERLERRG